MKISIIVPCYNEQEALPLFYEELNKVTKQLSSYDFEMLFVDDGSKDKTMEEIIKLADKDERVKYISFSRNFGKESAM
jgi:glycosyltransferase involved in cell wall biosynthesis